MWKAFNLFGIVYVALLNTNTVDIAVVIPTKVHCCSSLYFCKNKNAKMHIPKAQDKVSKGRQCQLASQAQKCILKLLLINIMIYTSEAGNRVAK